MSSATRRLRGGLLRLVFNRRAAAVTGCVLMAPAAALLAGNYAWESWITDGVGLVLGATGAALVLAGVGGRRADWIDLDESR